MMRVFAYNSVIINTNNQAYSKQNKISLNTHAQYDTVSFTSDKKIKGKEVAKATIIKKNIFGTKPIETVVTSRTFKEGFSPTLPKREKIEYRMYMKDGKLIGHMRLEDTKVNNFANFNKIYSKNKKADYIYITYLETINDKSLKGKGQKLVQASIEQSIKRGHKGRVKLTAEKLNIGSMRELPSNYGSPVGFYYEKCHFKVCSSDNYFKTDKDIEKELAKLRKEKKHPSESDLNVIRMYLPEDEIKNFWLPRIKENPIILSQKEIEKFEKNIK